MYVAIQKTQKHSSIALNPLGKLFAFKLDVPIEKTKRALVTLKASGHTTHELQNPVEIDRIVQNQLDSALKEHFLIG